MDKFNLLLILILILSVHGHYIENEICQGDSFEPQCSSNKIIVIGSAQYGRKKYGGCLSEGIGPIGCYEDVTNYVDSLCFGKSECSVYAADRHFFAANPCSSEYSASLEVSYECIPGSVMFLLDPEK